MLYQQLLTQLMLLQKQNTETTSRINQLKEMLTQLRLREDALELKLQRLQDVYFLPSFPQQQLGLNFGMFGNGPMGSQMNMDSSQFNIPPPQQSSAPAMNEDNQPLPDQNDNGNFNWNSNNQNSTGWKF